MLLAMRPLPMIARAFNLTSLVLVLGLGCGDEGAEELGAGADAACGWCAPCDPAEANCFEWERCMTPAVPGEAHPQCLMCDEARMPECFGLRLGADAWLVECRSRQRCITGPF